MSTLGLRVLSAGLGLGSVFFLASCMVQTDNSVNGDSSAFASAPSGASQAFSKVSAILKKNCATCHSDSFVSYSEQEMVERDYVVAGHPEESLLYGRLSASDGGGQFKENMPQGLPALSSDDLTTIRSWITALNLVVPTLTPTPVPTQSGITGTPFGNAQAIIANKCATCHQHSSWSQFAEADYISNGLVSAGSANNSQLYQNLIGANVPGVDGEMPLVGDPLTSDELLTISSWINQIQVAAPTPSPSPAPSPVVSPTPAPSVAPSPSGTPTLLNATQRTAAALAVIQNSCSACHSSTQTASSSAFHGESVAAFANFNSDAQFVSVGLIAAGNSAGDATGSWLLRSLKGNGDIASMPLGDVAISPEDLASLEAWIQGMGQP